MNAHFSRSEPSRYFSRHPSGMLKQGAAGLCPWLKTDLSDASSLASHCFVRLIGLGLYFRYPLVARTFGFGIQ